MEKFISFGKIAYRHKKRYNEVTVQLGLKKRDGPIVFYCIPTIWNRTCTDIVVCNLHLADLFPYLNGNNQFLEIYDLWKKYHGGVTEIPKNDLRRIKEILYYAW